MILKSAVGRGAANARPDVKAVQALLNLNGADPALEIDGVYGKNTQRAIDAFQGDELGQKPPSGVIETDSPTLEALRHGMPQELSPAKLLGILPECSVERAERYFPGVTQTMERYGINTPLRVMHFLAQIGHESGGFRYAEEIASGAAYEGRADLGNTQAGDGQRFKGRGLIQLTGRTNYAAYGKSIGRDLTVDNNWQLVADDPGLCVDVAGWYWARRNINALADRNDLEAVTKAINGGLNGLEDRRAKLARAQFFLASAPRAIA